MGILEFGNVPTTLLRLGVADGRGFLSLMMLTNDSAVPRPHFVSPTYGTTLPSTFDTILGTSTTMWGRHGARTTVGGKFIDVPRSWPPGTTTTGPESDPTQVDVGVPAAGVRCRWAKVPATARTSPSPRLPTPDDCPPPPGSGPSTSTPAPPPASDPGDRPKSGYTSPDRKSGRLQEATALTERVVSVLRQDGRWPLAAPYRPVGRRIPRPDLRSGCGSRPSGSR